MLLLIDIQEESLWSWMWSDFPGKFSIRLENGLCKDWSFWISFQTVKISLFKLSKFPFSNCQNFPFQNCQNFPFQTVKISLFKLSKFPFSKLSKFPFSNCQNFPFQTVKNSTKFPAKKWHWKTKKKFIKNVQDVWFYKLISWVVQAGR
jgi:hypothetical protein